MFIKTTKGVYELTENRKICINISATFGENGKVVENNHLCEYSKRVKNCIVKDLGEVIKQSENLKELIDEIVERHYKLIGMIWIGDDLVKATEWGNDKGEWVLYER